MCNKLHMMTWHFHPCVIRGGSCGWLGLGTIGKLWNSKLQIPWLHCPSGSQRCGSLKKRTLFIIYTPYARILYHCDLSSAVNYLQTGKFISHGHVLVMGVCNALCDARTMFHSLSTCVCVCVCVVGYYHFYQVSRLSLYGHSGVLGSDRSPL